jgi:hypothetical protein
MPGQEGQDFNDILVKQGKEEIVKQINSATGFYLNNEKLAKKTHAYYQEQAETFKSLSEQHEVAYKNKDKQTEYEAYKLFRDAVFFAINLEKDPKAIQLLPEKYLKMQQKCKETLYPAFFKDNNPQNIEIPKDPEILVKSIITRLEQKTTLLTKETTPENKVKQNNLEEELMTLIHYAERDKKAFAKLEQGAYKEAIEQRVLKYRSYKKCEYERELNQKAMSRDRNNDLELDRDFGLEMGGYELVMKKTEE